ncbi:MAG: hypothetical protein ABIR06_08120 [Cyclobacteriaceae bacterium]
MEPLFGSTIFEFVGAFTKWLYYLVTNNILGEERISFQEIYRGKKRLKSVDRMKNGMSNIGIGIINKYYDGAA